MGQSLYLRILTPCERRTGMIGADLDRRGFRAVDLSDCCFAYAACREIVFEDVDLRGAQFSGACLERARFVRCDLTGASFFAADVRQAQFITCRGLSAQQAGSLTDRQARIYSYMPSDRYLAPGGDGGGNGTRPRATKRARARIE